MPSSIPTTSRTAPDTGPILLKNSVAGNSREKFCQDCHPNRVLGLIEFEEGERSDWDDCEHSYT